jgi:segregation and condensation protein A
MPDAAISSPYTVKTQSFEGPLEILLSLIESRKLFVNEISLAEVTNDYIAYIRTLSDEHTHINDVSYFILIASTLILIKSKSLLPNLALTDDEEEKIVNLEHRLKLYQIIKNATVDVKTQFGTQVIFTPPMRIWSEPLFSPENTITSASMSTHILDVLAHIPQKVEKIPEIEIKKVINIDEMINSLTSRIQTAMNISFKEFAHSHNASSSAEVKVHVIVSFLAMLELVREGIIDVMQKATFDDMHISKQEIPIESNS